MTDDDQSVMMAAIAELRASPDVQLYDDEPGYRAMLAGLASRIDELSTIGIRDSLTSPVDRHPFGVRRRGVDARIRRILDSAVSQTKKCGACGKQVSNAAAAGQRCPHCGAYWSYEHTIQL